MSRLDFKQFSQRHRPHIHKPDSTLFVTYRLAGSIPQSTVRLYKAKRDWLLNAMPIVGNSNEGLQTKLADTQPDDKLKFVEHPLYSRGEHS